MGRILPTKPQTTSKLNNLVYSLTEYASYFAVQLLCLQWMTHRVKTYSALLFAERAVQCLTGAS